MDVRKTDIAGIVSEVIMVGIYIFILFIIAVILFR